VGGLGSGRREYATTPTVEECRYLDVNRFTDATEAKGGHIDISWGENTNIRAQIENDGEDDHVDALRFTYTTRPDTDDATEYSYRVPLDYTEPHFGGVRPWFVCPSCGTRRGKLYLPPRQEVFACRECYELVYTSSRSSGGEIDRARQRYKKAFAKADAENRAPHPNNAPFFPDRPKGMHHDTFEELVEDVETASEEWDRAFHRKLRRMNRHLSGVLDDLAD
jgi:hypothetical protein